jgi:hypothetical protein
MLNRAGVRKDGTGRRRRRLQAKGADTIVTQGATQSNHARQTTAAAAKLGMKCHILLEDRTGSTDLAYNLNGNVLLMMLHGTPAGGGGAISMHPTLTANRTTANRIFDPAS